MRRFILSCNVFFDSQAVYDIFTSSRNLKPRLFISNHLGGNAHKTTYCRTRLIVTKLTTASKLDLQRDRAHVKLLRSKSHR